MWKLWERLERAGLTGRQIEKFASGNILRVMNDVLRKSKIKENLGFCLKKRKLFADILYAVKKKQ